MEPVSPALNVKCAFCQKYNSNKDVRKQCGKMYGPFGDYYFHQLCGIWCPNIFFGDSGELIGVQGEVKRSNKLYCHLCGIKGAGLGCSE